MTPELDTQSAAELRDADRSADVDPLNHAQWLAALEVFEANLESWSGALEEAAPAACFTAPGVSGAIPEDLQQRARSVLLHTEELERAAVQRLAEVARVLSVTIATAPLPAGDQVPTPRLVDERA